MIENNEEEIVQDNTELMRELAESNDHDYNLRKALEEAIEFSEVMVKMLNKSRDNRPSMTDAVDEFGDVIVRGTIALMSLQVNVLNEDANITTVEEMLEERITKKLNRLRVYLKDGKYEKGV